MITSQSNLYSIIDWEEELDKINLHFLDLIKEEKPHFTTFIEILNILHFIGRDEEFLSLLEKIKLNINSMEEFIPWYHFFLNLITINNKEPKIILDEIEKFQKTSENLPKLLQEGLIWLKLEVTYTNNLITEENIDFERILDNTEDPWFYWRILYIKIYRLYSKGNYADLDTLFKKMKNHINNFHLEIAKANFFSLLGNYTSRSGKPFDSIKFFEKGIENALLLNSESILSTLHNNLGTAYVELGNYTNAEKIFEDSLKFQSNKSLNAILLNNIGYCNYCTGDFKKSLRSYFKAESILENINANRAKTTLGYIHLGFGLHKSREAKIDEAKENFKIALDLFKEHNDIHGAIYTHGMAARVFLDIQQFEMADKHFKLYLEKVDQINSYENYFSFYCLYIQFLLYRNAKNDKKLIEKHLKNLKSVKTKNNDNLIIKSWYDYIIANLEEKQFNLKTAEEILKEVIIQSQKSEILELTLRSIISLSEVLMRKYTYLKEENLLEEIFDYLSLANNKVNLNPIFPMNIYIKIYLAMIYSQKRIWKEVDQLLTECRKILVLSETKEDHYFYDLLNQIEGNKVIFSDLSKGLIQAFNLGIGKFFSKEKFKENEIGILMWKLTDIGPSIILKSVPEELIPKDQLIVSSTLMGTLLTTFLGQGEKYHEGVYGPLPVPTINLNKQVFCQVNSKIIKDRSQTDNRLLNRNFVILAVLYGENKDIDRLMLKNTLENWWKSISDLSYDNSVNFNHLKNMIIDNVAKIEQ